MEQVSILVAFAAGLLSFLSPCIFPLIPAYVSHLTGTVVKGDKIEVNKSLLLLRSVNFIIGFSVVFIIMGASATLLGSLYAGERDLIQKISGLFIIIFGMQMAGFLNISWLMKSKSWNISTSQKAGHFRSFMTGLAFGTGWSPCVGLALSSILFMASSSETLWEGIVLLTVYSLGMGVPFLLISWLLTYTTRPLKRMNKYVPLLSSINGWIFMIMGLLLYTGQLQKMSAWLSAYTLWDITF